MKKVVLFIFLLNFYLISTAVVLGQPLRIRDRVTPTVADQPEPSQPVEPSQPIEVGPRFAACDLCGYCPPNPPPKSWPSCQKCLYPNIDPDPSVMDSLKVDGETNLPPLPAPGKQYTFLGCLGGGGGGFSEEGAVGSVVQSLLNIVFSMAGGIAFLYLIYGSFIISTSQANPERLNYGKRVVYGAIAGLIFTLASVFIVKFIASGILKVPGFGETTGS